jgi:glycosyltransferase involved in cell wall biosynthesis
MKIGIEAQRIFRKKKHGMDIVAVQLIRELQKLDLSNQYFVFVKDDEDHTTITETANFKIVKIRKASYPYWEQVLLPKEAEKYGVEVLHCTSNTAPISTTIPLVITLHDIIYLEKVNFTKGTWYQIFGNFYRRWNVPSVVRKAARIITVSEYERSRILSHFRLPSQDVESVYNGVGEDFRKIDDPEILQTIKGKYNLPDNYVFYLGNTDPKKNMEGVMKALSLLRKRGKLSFKLLMLDIDRSYLHAVAARIGDPEILDHIVFSGYVPNRELPAIYSMARLFLYPSLRESFGIPLLEAMACGTAVITSNTSSMPEVAGDAALLVDPYAPESIADAIVKLLEDGSLRSELIAKGLNRSKHFTWKNNARKTLDIYKSIAN